MAVVPKLQKNPVATSGAPMGVTMCRCGHMYVEHVEKMPSPPSERKCLKCECAKFVIATDEQAREMDVPDEAHTRAEYERAGGAGALAMFNDSWQEVEQCRPPSP